ncbi:hypothetical protein SLS53_007961 [Cytospora paraplurivora]|uniref:Aminoglycoside phosphotransferase domain-containing protein n=1 Tax=Cytospora paraplurivora TaxID=2898453 RepID=A0AAN9U7X3_9PEZI
MDSTSTLEPEWTVDINELTAAVKKEIEICSKRYFYENIRGFRFVPKVLPPGIDCLWVKYKDEGPTLEAEACTQHYVYGELTKRDEPGRKGLHVPKVFDYAEIRINDFTYSFIIMEFIKGTPVSHITSDIEVSGDIDSQTKEGRIHLFEDRVVDALCFLLSLEPPSDARPGPVGGGRIQSFVFGRENSYAPRAFDTLGDLEEWVNEENEKKKINPYSTTADLVSEGLRLCYCDLHLGNFLLEDASNPASRLTVIDFQHTSWLPYSFLVWELWKKRHLYMEAQITARCGIEINKGNVEALQNIRLQRRWE